jgi:hypothetical protein
MHACKRIPKGCWSQGESESPFALLVETMDDSLFRLYLMDHGWEWVAPSLLAKEKLKELSALIIMLVGLPIRFSLANNRDSIFS